MAAQVLMLNSTYQPLGVIDLPRAVRKVLSGKAEIVRGADRMLRSAGNRATGVVVAFPLPSVIRLLYYVAHRRKHVPLTKKNVLLRDDYRCVYCGDLGGSEMTVDHVVPRSRGGGSDWTNLVACCSRCNSRKRDRIPAEAGMTLRRQPREPKNISWVVVRRHTMPNEWLTYLTTYHVGIEERPERT